ncbi:MULTISPECIES: RNA polymerase sigma factor [unclassified Frankia]|uniref:RNA polymerase sigma factor n=1 Tax=unclassified Frankia TaxID=2632575 RepID=UPI0040440272
MFSAAVPRSEDDQAACSALTGVEPPGALPATRPGKPGRQHSLPDHSLSLPDRSHGPTASGSGASRPDDFSGEQLQDLHRRLAAGDATALAEVHARYAGCLMAVATQVTADREAAAEIVQDVLVHLWEHPLRFDPGRGNLRAYLVVIARRRAVDWVRREHVRRPSDAVARELAGLPDGPAADAVVLSEATAAMVRQGVADLPHQLREAVELAFFDGCTYREAAARLTIPEGTVKSRIRTALHKLAVRLEREGVHS